MATLYMKLLLLSIARPLYIQCVRACYVLLVSRNINCNEIQQRGNIGNVSSSRASCWKRNVNLCANKSLLIAVIWFSLCMCVCALEISRSFLCFYFDSSTKPNACNISQMKLSWLAIGNALLYVWFWMQLLCVSFSFSLLLFAMVGSLLCELLSSGNGMPSQFAIIEPNRRHIFVCSVAVAAAIFFCYSSILCGFRTLSAYHI